ncbi:hypothetical protein Rs2_26764 [Raphanus sativus]|nr:hypothetical protein Rs2_26764 [Raphanus sativus]
MEERGECGSFYGFVDEWMVLADKMYLGLRPVRYCLVYDPAENIWRQDDINIRMSYIKRATACVFFFLFYDADHGPSTNGCVRYNDGARNSWRMDDLQHIAFWVQFLSGRMVTHIGRIRIIES